MNTRLILALLGFGLALFSASAAEKAPQNCGCSCCEGKKVCCCYPADDRATTTSETDKAAAPEVRHPVRGMIREVLADRSALLVKHEEIPGYMKAMTMLFQVDAETLASARKGQTIAGTLVEREGQYFLEKVKVVRE